MYNIFSKASILLLTLFVYSQQIIAQPQADIDIKPSLQNESFEGTIECVRLTFSDTTYYTYHIKDKKVRVDELRSDKKIENSLIFDLDRHTITAISPERKLYMNLPVKPYINVEDDNFEIKKSNNSKIIHGYQCNQWLVKNRAQNTVITYWVANDNFQFFEEFLKLWNRAEKSAAFYLQIGDSNGFFPMAQVERTLLREEREKQEVTRIKKACLDPSMFAVPNSYKSFDR